MAAPVNMTAAVDKLAMMFTTIERPTIQNVLVNECKGNATKAIVILTKIQEFNRSMNANNNVTSNSGEVVITAQQIPLQVPTVYNNNNNINNNNNAPQQQPDCCGNCSECCGIKPASYKNGLYNIDFKVYNISFLLFSLFTFYSDLTLDSLEISYYGLYLPPIGLILIFLGAIFAAFIRGDNDVGHGNQCGSVRGSLLFFGGLLYFLGYIIHATQVPDNNENDFFWWGRGENYAPTEYLVGRGIFVGLHAMFIGLLYVVNNKIPKFLAERNRLIRFWTLLFLMYSILCLCFLLPLIFIIVYMALSPFILVITLLLNCCLIKKSNESGGCNSGASLGLIIVISYYFQMVWFVLFIIFTRLYNYYYEEPFWYIVWEIALLMFASFQLWILTRAMHPVSANCGCIQDGSGDGNVTRAGMQQSQQPQVVMVVQRPQNEMIQTVVVPTVAVPEKQNNERDLYAADAVDQQQIPLTKADENEAP